MKLTIDQFDELLKTRIAAIDKAAAKGSLNGPCDKETISRWTIEVAALENARMMMDSPPNFLETNYARFQ